MSAFARDEGANFFALIIVAARKLRRGAYVLSGVLLATVSARAEAPVLSQEFWNYMIEFGDGKGEVFDPADYAAVSSMPSKAREEADRAVAEQRQRQQKEDGERAGAQEQPR
ncbi:MAG: hypothetical protein JWM78_1155 [Verrucomicrobiaceae bacterium]|nr:hypothetical protein [Verrucomicrobiaceae bacterium]